MRIVVFGTYEAERHPRVRVLVEGLRGHADEVVECNEPIGLPTAWRVRAVRRPWLLGAGAVRVLRAWLRLWRRSRRLGSPDVVVVGYLGHLDVHLARRLFPRAVIALDYLVSLADTARDRRVGLRSLLRALERVDRLALRAADVPFVDTQAQLDVVPPDHRPRAVVVPVGAPQAWFRSSPRTSADVLRVVFFGLYTPLQGAPVIGSAIAELADDERIRFTMIGSGQDLEETRRRAGSNPSVTWETWVEPGRLPDVVAAHDVCLGIFGKTPKARRVVPNKVFQGAAAGCAVVTSDTAPQREMLGNVGVYVPAGDAGALVAALRRMAEDRVHVGEVRRRTREHARSSFRPSEVVMPLRSRLEGLVGPHGRLARQDDP